MFTMVTALDDHKRVLGSLDRDKPVTDELASQYISDCTTSMHTLKDAYAKSAYGAMITTTTTNDSPAFDLYQMGYQMYINHITTLELERNKK